MIILNAFSIPTTEQALISLHVALSPSQAWCMLLTRIDDKYVHGDITISHSVQTVEVAANICYTEIG